MVFLEISLEGRYWLQPEEPKQELGPVELLVEGLMGLTRVKKQGSWLEAFEALEALEE